VDKIAISVGFLLLLGNAPAQVSLAAENRREGMVAAAAASKEIAPDDYKQLRARALAAAEVRVAPRQRNPGITSGGWEPEVSRILDQQQTYLASRPPSGHNEISRHTVPAYECNEATIRSVNGNHSGAIFTPRMPANVYIIEGCFFGNARGRIQLELRPVVSGQPVPSIALQLDNTTGAWSDHEIKVHLDAHVSGIPDSTVTLAIYPANGTRIELPGCFFVALRGEPQMLKVIPASWIRFDATKVRSRALQQLEYVSPPVKGNEVPKDAGETSALIVRSDSERFEPGYDTYDFSNLGPGWAVHSVQLQTYSIPCPADVTYAESFGHWDLTWKQRGFTVSWGGEACTSFPVPFFNFSLSFSEYAAKVWVIGPVGTQPVAGYTR
jgi:hypothetical protein